MKDDAFTELCNLTGIEPFSYDADGNPHPISPETRKHLLAALGGDPSDENAEEKVLYDMQWRRWQKIVYPVLIVPSGADQLALELRLPEKALQQPIRWVITKENGETIEGEINIQGITPSGQAGFEGETYASFNLQLPISLPCGYHTLSVTATPSNGQEAPGACTIIITPETCYIPSGLEQEARTWGISCRLDAIRSKRNWGIGDFTDLKNILSWAAENGAGIVAVNPLQFTIFPEQWPINLYQPSCYCFLSPLFIDPQAVTDFHESEEAQNFVQYPAFQVRLSTLREQDLVDYKEVIEIKLALLEVLWRHFQQNHLDPETGRGRDFRRFQQAGGEELRAYSVFEGLHAHFKAAGNDSGRWTNWPEQFQDSHSPEVADFAEQNRERIEFYHYIQWQSELQLEAIGRRSLELGLKVGLLQALPISPGPESFETWHKRHIFAMDMKTHPPGIMSSITGKTTTHPVKPWKLTETAYGSFIEMLRAAMRHAGALRIIDFNLADRLSWMPVAGNSPETISVRYPSADLVEIIKLESQRNRCLIIYEHCGELTKDFCDLLLQKGFFLSRPGHFERDDAGNWLPPDRYPPQTVVAAGGCLNTSLHGFWVGRDIALLTGLRPSDDGAGREKMIISRAADRAHLLVAVKREGLLPEGYDVDPATVPRMTPVLARAVHLFLAKTVSKIFLLQLQDIPCLQELEAPEEISPEPPDQQKKIAMDIETIQANDQLHALFLTFCRERGIGVVRPSALLADRRESKTAKIPHAFYRLQLNACCTFQQAAAIVPYLKELGISHCYASPYLKARPGSAHGYDIIDHSSLNPEIGNRQDFEKFVAALDRHGMAQILDMVPNHMGVGSDNKWWVDVLENGQASIYADFFDINWQPLQEELKGRILLPVLGDYYGSVLEGGLLNLVFSPEKGAFFITYYEHSFPIAPRTFPFILGQDFQRIEDRMGPRHEGLLELHSLMASFTNLPDRLERSAEKIEIRHRNKEVLKRLLARLCREHQEIATFISENIILFNGEKGRPESFDLLHKLLGMQVYRLAYWRVASDEINYRRFFDINDLAGIRTENRIVFEETHRFVLDLIATGRVDGLRIDHPDGLYDPVQYYRRLQSAVSGESIENGMLSDAPGRHMQPLPFYVVVEKILADFESLPTNWLVHGSTGYEFAANLNGLFVDPDAEKTLTGIYNRFIGNMIDFGQLLYNCKKMIIKIAMSGELNVLASKLYQLAGMNRYTQDYTLNGLREALIEIIAFFPVYRTYIAPDRVSRNDRKYIEWAVTKAIGKQQAEDTGIYDFVKAVLLLEVGKNNDDSFRTAAKDFVMKLQQYTAPVMAKGMEDTAFYIYNRLVSLNEVGGDPRCFSVSVSAFHHANKERIRRWPNSMLSTSTHDSKRSEDVRARINVLSEMPLEWQAVLNRWSGLNRNHKTKIDNGGTAPSRNDEYALYQNLLGIWPLEEMDRDGEKQLQERFEVYMLKVIREAKVHTSWIKQNAEYEEAVTRFVQGLFEKQDNTFFNDFCSFQKKIARFGMLNSLSQLMLKLTSPGVPDIYQGNEIWHFRLVDPDNRRPVDFEKRKKILEELKKSMEVSPDILPERVRNLLDNLTNGWAKMYIVWKTLAYRRKVHDLFEQGSYLTLAARGEKRKHLCAFARNRGDNTVIVAVPRLVAGLLDQDDTLLPLGEHVWSDTVAILPDTLKGQTYRNILTGEERRPQGPDKNLFYASELFAGFPVAILKNTTETGAPHD